MPLGCLQANGTLEWSVWRASPRESIAKQAIAVESGPNQGWHMLTPFKCTRKETSSATSNEACQAWLAASRLNSASKPPNRLSLYQTCWSWVCPPNKLSIMLASSSDSIVSRSGTWQRKPASAPCLPRLWSASPVRTPGAVSWTRHPATHNAPFEDTLASWPQLKCVAMICQSASDSA